MSCHKQIYKLNSYLLLFYTWGVMEGRKHFVPNRQHTYTCFTNQQCQSTHKKKKKTAQFALSQALNATMLVSTHIKVRHDFMQ